MPSAELSHRVEKVVGYPPLWDMGEDQRGEFHETLLDADSFEDLPGEVAGGDHQCGAEPAEVARRQRRLMLSVTAVAGAQPR